MMLLERDSSLDKLRAIYRELGHGRGHSIFIIGEAGIGKTALVNTFLQEAGRRSPVLLGMCDSLFTPRPLGPLYDISAQLGEDFWALLGSEPDKSIIFTRFIQQLSKLNGPAILVFEDIHWADAATLDLIKFLCRRISRVPCMFILTCRDREMNREIPLPALMADLSPDDYTRLSLEPLSEEAVGQLARQAGYPGQEVFQLTRGNPFFVREILADYSLGIPETVKDSVLSVFNKGDQAVRELWERVCLLPGRVELWLLELLNPDCVEILLACINAGILVGDGRSISFKHDLYRLIIEESLPALKRRVLNKEILEIMLQHGDERIEPARLVHHARNAEDFKKVAELAPLAARHAARLHAHREAANLYREALQYAGDQPPEARAELLEQCAYECYLTNQIESAKTCQEKALAIWRETGARIREGNALRFLSRLNWFSGNGPRAETLAQEAVSVLENGFPTRERAMAYSNLAQLKMLAEESEACLHWGQRAIDLAQKLQDDEVLAHALNNVGTIRIMSRGSALAGEQNLLESLQLSLKNGYNEHVARAYTNLGSSFTSNRFYQKAAEQLAAGIAFCREHDLDSWTYYMLSWQARLHLETGDPVKAEEIAADLVENAGKYSTTRVTALVVLGQLKLRRGDDDALRWLNEAKELALATAEVQRMAPALVGLLEYHWVYHPDQIPQALADWAIDLRGRIGNRWLYSDLEYWIWRCGIAPVDPAGLMTGFQLEIEGNAAAAAEAWATTGCPYFQALALSCGTETEQLKALALLEQLGAAAVVQRLKLRMRSEGIRRIPRGRQRRTRENPAQLTARQLEVLKLLRNGLQNKEIAEQLFISAKTVDHHISAILAKLEVDTRARAEAEARSLGIFE
ncbi:MAG TPA: AAA family ATPase [Flavilitoribacter sp.]|nr:AAA family ATPase [Flavilitoribacter sp.]